MRATIGQRVGQPASLPLICARPPRCCSDFMQTFLMSELGTSGSLDGTQRLIVKGRFLPKAFETVLRRCAEFCV